jgi:Transglutaminase-like superfamily
MGGLIEEPADIWLAVRMTGWALVLPLLTRLVSFPRLARWLSRAAQRRTRPHDPERIARLGRAIYGRRTPLRDNCLGRSLLTYRFLAEADADVRLVVAVRQGIHGHVWVTLGDRPLLEDETALAAFEPLFVVGRDGRVERTREMSPR